MEPCLRAAALLPALLTVLAGGICTHAQPVNPFFLLNSFPYDTTFVDLPAQWSGRVYAVSKYHHLRLGALQGANRISYKPDRTLSAGLGISYQTLALDLAAGIVHLRRDSAERSKSIDFFSTVFMGPHVAQIIYQSSSGFLVSYLPTGSESWQQLFVNDLKERIISISYLYHFNGHRYSALAPLTGTQVQRRSAGSWLAGVFGWTASTRHARQLFPEWSWAAQVDSVPITRMTALTGGLLAGYAHTFILPRSFLLHVAAAPGLALARLQFYGASYTRNQISPSPYTLLQAAAGYQGALYYALLSFQYTGSISYPQGYNLLQYNSEKIKFTVGRRW